MTLRRLLIATVAVAASFAVLSAVPAQARPAPITGSITAPKSLGLQGVSPHAVALPDGSVRLYYSSMEGGTAVERCTLAGACVRQGIIPGVSDLTTVTLVDGTQRGYFVQFDPNTQAKAISTAVMSADGLGYSAPIPVGIASAPGERAWGVPDSVVLPDGRVRLYWVEVPAGSRGEAIVSATSTDVAGTTFVRDPGLRLKNGLVDFEVLQARDGAWIGISSSTPGTPPQRLFLATSKDGLTWQVNKKAISPSSRNFLDPTGLPVGPNRFTLYVTISPKATPFDGFVVNQTRLRVKLP